MIFYACLLVVYWASSLVTFCAASIAAPRLLHLTDLVKGLAARCRSSIPEGGCSPALTKGIGWHGMIVWCERSRSMHAASEFAEERELLPEPEVERHQTATYFRPAIQKEA